jgi:lysophospholipase L1-like esterase
MVEQLMLSFRSTFRSQRLRVCVIFAIYVGTAPLFAQQNFALHDRDVVVFYGDSITAQQLYTVYAETAVRALHPEWKLRFYNAGVGGDKVTGGIAGTADERLTRDVFSRKPTVITIMLGMNDRNRNKKDPEAGYLAFVSGYRHLLEQFARQAPTARVYLIGPSPLDDITRVHDGGNDELIRFSSAVQKLAEEFHMHFLDFNRPVTEMLHLATSENLLAAEALIPDRVHPQGAVHLRMAQALLDAWHYPATFASVELEAGNATLLQANGSQVSGVEQDADGSLLWTERDTPDSIPFVQVDANLILWKRFAPGPHLGHRLLQVRALDRRAHYQLMIDGLAFGSALDVETLRRGINLDDLDTPMHLAARTLNYASADSQLNQVVRTRLIGRHGLETAGKPTFLEGASDLNDAVEASEQAAEKASQPTEHKFRLQRIVMVP